MDPTRANCSDELPVEVERLCRLRRAHPVLYAWTVGRERTMRRVARWGLVAILLFISAAFAVLAAQFAAGSAPRCMFGAVAIALVLIVAALLAAWFKSPARRMSAIELARQDAAELLRKRGSRVVSREDHA